MKVPFCYHTQSFLPEEDGRIIVLKKESIAPIEILEYGINEKGNYYLDWTYPLLGDYELENDYREISKERILNDLRADLSGNNIQENIDVIKKAIDYVMNRD